MRIVNSKAYESWSGTAIMMVWREDFSVSLGSWSREGVSVQFYSFSLSFGDGRPQLGGRVEVQIFEPPTPNIYQDIVRAVKRALDAPKESAEKSAALTDLRALGVELATKFYTSDCGDWTQRLPPGLIDAVAALAYANGLRAGAEEARRDIRCALGLHE